MVIVVVVLVAGAVGGSIWWRQRVPAQAPAVVAETPVVHGATSAGIFSVSFRDSLHGMVVGGGVDEVVLTKVHSGVGNAVGGFTEIKQISGLKFGRFYRDHS